MARQRIPDKQQAILAAAIEVFAARGFWDTPTSLISKTAGIADGTLFNYFKSKDELINAVYLTIKQELAAQMLEELPAGDAFESQLRHVWHRYIAWGVQHPQKFAVLQQIGASYELDDAVKAEGLEPFLELQQLASEHIQRGTLHSYPVDFLTALLEGLAVTTIHFITTTRADQAHYAEIGFEIMWRGLTR